MKYLLLCSITNQYVYIYIFKLTIVNLSPCIPLSAFEVCHIIILDTRTTNLKNKLRHEKWAARELAK